MKIVRIKKLTENFNIIYQNVERVEMHGGGRLISIHQADGREIIINTAVIDTLVEDDELEKKEKIKMNWNLAEKITTDFIRKYVHDNGFENVVIGVSGGLDSAVVATLCVKALGKEHVHGLLMPYCTSSAESMVHGHLVCNTLGITSNTIDITPQIDAYFRGQIDVSNLRIGNKCARERMSVLYDYSVVKKALVAGTSNKSEYLLGYCTQYGDGSAAFEPIADIYKSKLFDFARYLGVPDVVISKKPSADLWVGQTDEGEIGVTYEEMDEILTMWVDFGFSIEEIVGEGHSFETVGKIVDRMKNSEFKRAMPPIRSLPSIS